MRVGGRGGRGRGMSDMFTRDRLRRIQSILDLLELNPEGLRLQTIAKETKLILEIKRNTLVEYIQQLEWSGIVVTLKDGRIKLRR